MVGLVFLLGIVSVPVGWVASDAVERNNDFCNACHISARSSSVGPSGGGGDPGTVPLHIDIRRAFDARPAANLAGLHGERMDDVRCIDCHGGVGLVGRARVKWLAAKDAWHYLIGDFEEPTEMTHPLLDADCLKCHADVWAPREGREDNAFHALGVHATDLEFSCVQCHDVHEMDGAEDFYFLRAAHVRARCATCHSEYED